MSLRSKISNGKYESKKRAVARDDTIRMIMVKTRAPSTSGSARRSLSGIVRHSNLLKSFMQWQFALDTNEAIFFDESQIAHDCRSQSQSLY